MRKKEYICSYGYLLERDSGECVMCYLFGSNLKDMFYPTAEELISRLENPEYLNYRSYKGPYTERELYILNLSKRPDLTETQKRLIKLYKSKLTTDATHND